MFFSKGVVCPFFHYKGTEQPCSLNVSGGPCAGSPFLFIYEITHCTAKYPNRRLRTFILRGEG